jgi:type I restriction enzyme M protein
MAIKKSQLYSALWDGCDELRGGMDASQYKDYVLVVLFVKYISDKAKKDTDMLISVPEGCSFDDMVALKGKTNIGEEMNKILEKLAEANGLTGVITNADFSDENKLGKGKDLVETVSKLIAVFQREELDFSNNRAADDDLIGDAYEYLMKNFASESGKSKGQFYTPAEVSRIMAKVIGIGKDERQMISIYDPTCGSGSLLLRAKAEAKHNVSIDGQEKDLATIGMARMSMIIHGVDDAELRHGDTLNDPLHKENDTTLQTFDYVVANPPFSMKGWRKSAKEQDIFGRWGFGDNFAPVPPPGCGDYAFLLHIVKSLKTQGHAACILPHGVLFRGGAEAEIRKFLVKKRWISGIIGLPSNLFYGTGIPACIIIIDKEHAAGSKGIFMIDAKEGFQKDGAKNRLREQDIKLIVDTWEAHEPVPHYAKFVPFADIAANDYNLNIPRYVVPEDKEIRQDIYAHLHGGLPAHDVEEVFAQLWEACPSLKDRLFRKEANGYYSLVPAADCISEAVNADASYQKQNALYAKVIEDWCQKVDGDMLASVKEECEPKSLIERWSGMLLEGAKADLKLVDPYNVYEILMNYWAETMQDDCYMVSRDGWKVALRDTKKKSTFDDLECDLLPVSVVVNKFFAADYASILSKRGKVEQLSGEIEALPEENPDAFDEGLYEMLEKVNEANVKKAVAALKKHAVEADATTVKVWNKYLELCGRKKEVSKALSALVDVMTEKVREEYGAFKADEIRNLVVYDKWLQELKGRSVAENKRVCESISSQVSVLNERYAKPLPKINEELAKLSGEVDGFLRSMGINL